MSIAETLVALLIVSLLTMGIATGVAFAARQYNNAMLRSKTSILCSTLTSALTSELSNTTKIKLKQSDENTVESYHSVSFPQRELSKLTSNSNGHFVYDNDDNKYLLNPAAYSSKDSDLRVKLDKLEYTKGTNVFSVGFTIYTLAADNSEIPQLSTEFDVLPFNKPRIIRENI